MCSLKHHLIKVMLKCLGGHKNDHVNACSGKKISLSKICSVLLVHAEWMETGSQGFLQACGVSFCLLHKQPPADFAHSLTAVHWRSEVVV